MTRTFAFAGLLALCAALFWLLGQPPSSLAHGGPTPDAARPSEPSIQPAAATRPSRAQPAPVRAELEAEPSPTADSGAPTTFVPTPPGSILGRLTYSASFAPGQPQVELVRNERADSVQLNLDLNMEQVRWPSASGARGEVAWSIEGLEPGTYRVSYARRVVQEVVVRSGPNTVYADLTEPSEVRLSFVDAVTGLPVEARSVRAMGLSGDTLPDRFAMSIGIFGLTQNPGTSCLIQNVFADQLAYDVRATGYQSALGIALVHDGAEHFVELSPAIEVRVRTREFDGSLSEVVPDPRVLQELRLVVGGDVFEPSAVRSSKAGSFISFGDINAGAGSWRFGAPAPWKVLSEPSGAFGAPASRELVIGK